MKSQRRVLCERIAGLSIGLTWMGCLVGCGDDSNGSTPASGGGGGIAGGSAVAGAGGSGGVQSTGGSGGSGGHQPTISELSFPVPTLWAEPIEDYLLAGFDEVGNWNFMRGIHDLVVYLDRLYLGYGDANENLGRVIPIGFRYFASAQQPTATNEFDSDEEQLDHFRLIGDDLFMPGVDATEDAWLGNVYFRRSTSGWVKSRTLDEGVHVHDVVGFQNNHYAVGSGSSEQEWNNGDIYAHLWRSTDSGESFDIVAREHNGGTGDARWVWLLPNADGLYLFGYTSNAQFKIDNLIGGIYDGNDVNLLAEAHTLRWVFVTQTDVIGTPETAGAIGIVRGVNLQQSPLRYEIWKLDSAGNVTPITGLAGKTVLDIYEHPPTGEVLLLTNDDYQASFNLTEWDVKILLTTEFESFTELVSFHTDVPPKSLAYWQGHLFYGTDHGQLWRASGQTTR